MGTRPAAFVAALSMIIAAVGCAPEASQEQEDPRLAIAEHPDKATDTSPTLPVDFVVLPEGSSDGDWIPDHHLELLCNPDRHRFILHTSPPQHRSVDGYPKRHVWDVNDLYVSIWQGFRGDQGFASSRRSFATCGDY